MVGRSCAGMDVPAARIVSLEVPLYPALGIRYLGPGQCVHRLCNSAEGVPVQKFADAAELDLTLGLSRRRSLAELDPSVLADF
jgi:hypothetical protein